MEFVFTYSNIIDLREEHFFNGWPSGILDGHLQYSLNVPYYWLELDPNMVLKIIQEKAPKKEELWIISEDPEHATNFKKFLEGHKIPCQILSNTKMDGLIQKYGLTKLPRYQKLVYAEWVHTQIENPKSMFKLYHVGFKDKDVYLKGHIPKAYYFDLSEIEKPPNWQFMADKEIIPILKKYGIHQDMSILLYGDNNIAAYRFALVLFHLGVKDIRILDGGLTSWKYKGYQLEKEENVPEPCKDFDEEFLMRDVIRTLKQVEKMLEDKEFNTVVDIRSREEHEGRITGYDYVKHRGRIQGSVWGYGGTDVNDLADLRNFTKTMLNFEELQAKWKIQGIVKEKNNCFYCGTGWRASEAFFYAYFMGWDKISLYDGGWKEWGEEMERRAIQEYYQ